MVNKEILILWKELVVAVGASKPKRDDLEYINHTWCPEDTYDAKFIRELRPELKEILSQSLSGELSKEGFNTKITRRTQFKRLMNEIHQNIAQIDDAELFHWSRYNVKGVKKEMWSSIGPESKRHLRISLSRYFDFQEKMVEIHKKMKMWIKEYQSKLKDYNELLELNSQLEVKKYKEQLALSQKRLDDAIIIRNKLPDLINDPVHGLKNKMRQEVLDAIFSGSTLSQIPNWAAEIDDAKTTQNMILLNKFMELEVETPPDKLIDRLVSELAEIMNGRVEEILVELSKINIDLNA
jgi:hypothetical protein